MAEEESAVIDDELNTDVERRDLRSLLSSVNRDYLVRNNGDEIKIDELQGKTVGLYFSGSWCGPCRRFTPILEEAYTELASSRSNFEVVFISSDEDDEDFSAYFAKMPWLAIPFSDEETRDSLSSSFDIQGIPTLVVIDNNGRVLTEDGVEVVRNHGAEGFPFTDEKIDELKKAEEAAKLNQTIRSLLVNPSRDFVYKSNFEKVPVSDLEEKIVGLYFSLQSFEACAAFTQKLANVYSDLKGRGENFEVVLVSLEDDESLYKEDFENMPWLGLPFKDKKCEKLVRYFELEEAPALVVIGEDGKTANENAVEMIVDYGADAYPFTPEKLKELKKKEKARIENQTLEALLVSGGKDFVIRNDGSKVPVSDLVGKNILLYFSAHWCPPCRAFLPRLIDVYDRIKERDPAFEIIFISSDEDEESFENYFSKMHWLALPFWDERKRFLSRIFKITGIPSCVAINPDGKTITKDARSLIVEYGASAYPFTKEAILQIKAEMDEKAQHWPEKIRRSEHEHVLKKSPKEAFCCDGCGKVGHNWSYFCKNCEFDLHPDCALDGNHEVVDSDDEDDADTWPTKIKNVLHRHVLVKAWRYFECDSCSRIMRGWSYFCQPCDFDLHRECAIGDTATFEVVGENEDGVDNSDDNEDEDLETDEDEDDEESLVEVEDENEPLHNNLERALQISELVKEKVENGDKSKDEHEEDGNGKRDDDDEDEEDDDVDSEDDEDGPSIRRGHVCDTREREGSDSSFQDSLFTCKIYR